MKYVLFVCTHNAGRSQMAQALFERHAPADVKAESAGQEPAAAVWPNVVEAMAELGIDIGTAAAEEAGPRDAAARRLGDHARLRRRLPLRADDGRGLADPGPPPASPSRRLGRSAI